MSDNNVDVILISDDNRLRAAASNSKPSAATLLCISACELAPADIPRAAHCWIDLDCFDHEITGPWGRNVYFYTRLLRRHRRLPEALFIPKLDAADVLDTLWAEAIEDATSAAHAARAHGPRDALPAWILDCHELDLREWCHRCVRTLPANLGFEDIAIYLHHADQHVLTLAETNADDSVDLSIATDDGAHLLTVVAKSTRLLTSDDIAETCAANGWSCPPNLSRGENRAAVVIPLVADAELGGVIVLSRRRGDGKQCENATLDLIARFLSRGLSHARRHLRARREARIDRLTGLFNDRWMTESLEREIRRAQRFNGPLSLIMIDLDRLKQVNDRLGHLAGDALIRHIARKISAALRQIDSAARIGGDEFVVLLPSTDTSGARHVARRIQYAIRSDSPLIGGEFLPVSVSLGLAEWQAGWDARRLLEAADQAMYAAKHAARNRPRSADTRSIAPTDAPRASKPSFRESQRR